MLTENNIKEKMQLIKAILQSEPSFYYICLKSINENDHHNEFIMNIRSHRITE